jgi:hypothetical protein
MGKAPAVVAGLAAMAVIGVAVYIALDHGGGDPGGQTMGELRPVVEALPADAKILYRNDVEPQWDSCDGRPGTFGWNDVVVQVHFDSNTGPDGIFSHADSVLGSQGWRPLQLPSVPTVTQRMWTKSLNGALPKVQIAKDSYGTSAWTLFAAAPPQGQRVSGC